MSGARRGLVVLSLALAVVAAFPALAAARSLVVTDANVDLRIAPDAALLGREELKIEYDGHWQATYRDIILKKGETVTNVSVKENGRSFQPGGCTSFGCTDQEGRFGVTQIPSADGEGVRVVWHVNATDVTRDFVLSYRVEDAVVAYDDVLDLEWQVWGDQWDFDLDTLVATVTDPSLEPGEATPEKPSAVWGKPREVEGDESLEPGVARLEASDVRSGQFVEMRVLLPREPGQNVSAARVEKGDGLVKVLEEEDALTEDFNSPFNKAKRWVAHNAILLSALLAALAFGVLALMRFMAREYSISVPKHLPDPPDDATPALAYGLAHEGEDSTDTALATLLGLVELGFYETKTTDAEDEKLDLSIKKASKRPSADKLQPDQKATLDFFDALIEDDTVPMSAMKDRIPEHDATWRSRWETMSEALNTADEGTLEWDRNMNPPSLLLALIAAIAFGAIALAYNNVEQKWLVPAAIGAVTVLVIALWPATALKRLSRESRERAAKWQAFERWTRDFPSLKDDPPATLQLWKKILVYGVAFGTAERMIESGRIPEPVLQSAEGTWTGTYFTGNYVGSSFDGNQFSSGFSSQVAPEASSSGGGGGFSGGGGGASGGGGGGGW